MSENFFHTHTEYRTEEKARARTVPLSSTLIRPLIADLVVDATFGVIFGVIFAVIVVNLVVFLVPGSTVPDVLIAGDLAFAVGFTLNVLAGLATARIKVISAVASGVGAAVLAAGLVFLVPASTMLEGVIAAVMAFAGGFLLNGRTGFSLRKRGRDER